MNNKSKSLQELMKRPYTTILRRDDEGDVVARIKELEGCVADGQDEIEAIANLEQVKQLWFLSCLASQRPVPMPEEERELFSGKWLQRVPRSLHKKLVEGAESEGVSLNHLVTSLLSEAIGHQSGQKQKAPGGLESVNAGTYVTGTSKTRLSIVKSKETAAAEDVFESIQYAVDQLPKKLKFSDSPSFKLRHASGY